MNAAPLHAFSDLIGEPLPSGTPPPQRNRDCARCTKLAEEARKAGLPAPTVDQCESWMRDGVRYWTGLCVDCGDFEWSWRWNLLYDLARDDDARRALDRERQRRMAKGRRFYATAGKP